MQAALLLVDEVAPFGKEGADLGDILHVGVMVE